MTRTALAAAAILIPLFDAAGQTPPPPVISPEVASDRTITFRLRAPNARDVSVAIEGMDRQAMRKDDQGVWTLTTAPLEPDLYGYSFYVDDARMIDPSNSQTKPNLLNLSSAVHVPGPASLPWEPGDVPRGAIHHHFYTSGVIGDRRDYFVYTPPGYDATASRAYPTLYLLHGYSDDASAWWSVGRAHVILDKLIAGGSARPMLIVMPLGYGVPDIVRQGLRDVPTRRRSYEKFRDALFSEVIPQVEKSYRASKSRNDRAIAGLSMGGAESLFVGLNALDRFAWIGAFSTGGMDEDLGAVFPSLTADANSQLRLLWIACGTADRLIDVNRATHQWLQTKGVRHTWLETPGAHTWMVWRRNLAAFAPLLFTEKTSDTRPQR